MDYSLNQDFDGVEDRPHQSQMPMSELASLPNTVLLHGKLATHAQVLAWSQVCGFDPQTGFAKPSYDGGGAVVVEVEGKKISLYWKAQGASK